MTDKEDPLEKGEPETDRLRMSREFWVEFTVKGVRRKKLVERVPNPREETRDCRGQERENTLYTLCLKIDFVCRSLGIHKGQRLGPDLKPLVRRLSLHQERTLPSTLLRGLLQDIKHYGTGCAIQRPTL